MNIKWLGHAAFLLTADSTRVAIDPFQLPPEERSIRFDYPPIREDADLVLISHEHFDHNGADAIGGTPEVLRASAGAFDSPVGEIIGVASEHDPAAGTRRGANTIFRFTLDGVRCCHMGDFGQSGLRSEQREAIGEIDLLFVPVGGGPTADGRQAAEIVAQLKPATTIPMHYATEAIDFVDGPEEFLAAVPADVSRAGTSEIELNEFAGSRDHPAVVVLEAPAPVD
jgi:L-ascorbate metabolism protein UlaG (beta-lactamase superfamily)